MAELYVNSQEVLDVIGGPPQSKPSAGSVEQFILEAQSAVEGAIGALPAERNTEIAGIIRDLAASRAIFLMRGAQSSEPPRAAAWLAEDARRRLADLDARTVTAGGVKEVDEGAYSNPQETDLFTLEDAGLVVDDGRYTYKNFG